MKDLFIHRTAAFLASPQTPTADLKTLLKRHTRDPFRRANRFILLALAGVHVCLEGIRPPVTTSVWVTTENGNLGDTENVLHQLYARREFPMPYSFINTMSNTAAFYVAKDLGLKGRNLTVSSSQLSFERGLELMATDLGLGRSASAILGAVDTGVFSEKAFAQKTGIDIKTLSPVEGSTWFWCQPERQGALAVIEKLVFFPSCQDGLDWLAAHPCKGGADVLAFGLSMRPDEYRVWQQAARCEGLFDYITPRGYFDSLTAFGISDFLTQKAGIRLTHVNRNLQGQYAICRIRRLR